MSNKWHFWRNVALIVVAHVIAVVGLVRWSASSNAKPQSIVWVAGDLGDGGGPSAVHRSPPPVQPLRTALPERTPQSVESPDDDSNLLVSAKSEIELPAPTATPTPTPTVRPTVAPLVKAPPKPSPRPPRKPRPKPTPTATPKPTPKPKPKKTLLAKVLHRPTPQARPAPAEADEESDREDNETGKADSMEKDHASETEKGADKGSENNGGSSNGSGGVAGSGKGMSRSSELASYGRMLHDRFYSEWIQPTTSVASAAKISTVVRVRIEKNGGVSSFEITKPSGNVMIDDSVAAIGKQVTQVDPLPAALRSGGHYDVKINFELNSD